MTYFGPNIPSLPIYDPNGGTGPLGPRGPLIPNPQGPAGPLDPSGGSTVFGGPWDPRPAADAYQKAMDYKRWVAEAQAQQARAAQAEAGAAPQSGGGGAGGGGSGGGGGGAGISGGGPLDLIHQQYNAQVAEINRMHDAELKRLEGLHGNAAAGVKQGGVALQGQLHGLAGDARTQLGQVNQQIAGNYDRAAGADNAEYRALLADLKRQGADTQGLAAQLGANRSSIGMDRASQTSLGQRYGQLLQQSLNERQALGQTITRGSLNDLRQILTAGQTNVEKERGTQLSKLKMQLDQAIAEAQARIASASRGGGGGGGGGGRRGGGGGGSSSSSDGGDVSLSDRAKALNYAQDALPQYGDAFSGMLGGNSNSQAWAAQQLSALAQGATPQQLLAEFDAAHDAGHRFGFHLGEAHTALTLAAAADFQSQQNLSVASQFYGHTRS